MPNDPNVIDGCGVLSRNSQLPQPEIADDMTRSAHCRFEHDRGSFQAHRAGAQRGCDTAPRTADQADRESHCCGTGSGSPRDGTRPLTMPPSSYRGTKVPRHGRPRAVVRLRPHHQCRRCVARRILKSAGVRETGRHRR
jgi:hypothetical protein